MLSSKLDSVKLFSKEYSSVAVGFNFTIQGFHFLRRNNLLYDSQWFHEERVKHSRFPRFQ